MNPSQSLPNPLGKHDPDAALCGPWNVKLELDPGLTLVEPLTVVPFDGRRGFEGASLTDDFAIVDVAYVLLDANKNEWGVSFNTRGGNAQMYRGLVHYSKSDGTDDHEAFRIESVRKVQAK